MQHSCLFYRGLEEALQAGARHLKAGLARGERCLFSVAREAAPRAREALAAVGVDVRARERRGELLVIDGSRFYVSRGRLDRGRILARWRELVEEAGREGRPGLRVAADMVWAFEGRSDPSGVASYESEVNRLAPMPLRGLCLYPKDRVPALLLDRFLCAHPWVDANGARRENPYYLPPDDFRRGAAAPRAELMLERLSTWGPLDGRAGVDESEVMPVLAHQFRTPLTAIRCFAETLSRNPRAPERDEFLKTISRNASRLSRLVDELLVLGRFSAPPRPAETIQVPGFLRRVAAEFRPLARRGEVAFEQSCVPGLRARARRLELQQALQSLIENAIKLTPSGGRVAVSACRRSGMVEFSVADTGPGLAPRELPRLFERFYRGEAGRAADPLGSGLGLYIARRFVEAQGGRIWAESEPGAGACFRFTVPAA